MGKVIAPLASGSVPEHTVFDRRFVVECCERFHIHWRNLRLELTAENWIELVSTFERAIATWRAHGSPREHPHLELAKHLMDTREVVHPTAVAVEPRDPAAPGEVGRGRCETSGRPLYGRGGRRLAALPRFDRTNLAALRALAGVVCLRPGSQR